MTQLRDLKVGAVFSLPGGGYGNWQVEAHDGDRTRVSALIAPHMEDRWWLGDMTVADPTFRATPALHLSPNPEGTVPQRVTVTGAWLGRMEADVFAAIIEAAFVGLEGLGEMTPAQEKAFEIAREAL